MGGLCFGCLLHYLCLASFSFVLGLSKILLSRSALTGFSFSHSWFLHLFSVWFSSCTISPSSLFLMPFLLFLAHCLVWSPFWPVLSVLSSAFPTGVVLGFNLSRASCVSLCLHLQGLYLALDVFLVEPQLCTHIVHPEVKEVLQNQGYHGELDGCLKTPTMQSFPNGYSKKEGSFRWDCVVFLKPHLQSTFFASMSQLSLPNNVISRSRAFSCLLTIIPHFWTIYTPVIICSHQWLSNPPWLLLFDPLTRGAPSDTPVLYHYCFLT